MKKIKILGILVLSMCLLTMSVFPVYAKEYKTLYFEEYNGKMVWNNVRGSDGNWFMSFINMVPGGKYTDQLQIKNGSKKTYKLYMQVIPVQQDQKKKELLELISMKVLLDSGELYMGTASGKIYDDGNLQDVVYIGTYEPDQKGEIIVELQLDKNMGLEYSDLLTEIDWKFMVTEVSQPDNVKPIQPPKTGDNSTIELYMGIWIVSMAAIIVIGKRKIFSGKRYS